VEGTRPLRAAIIGCGRMGGTIDDEVAQDSGVLLPYGHAPAYLAAAGVELAAAVDVDAARLQAFADRFHIAGRYADHRAMLREVRPDIVSVTTRAVGRAAVVLELIAAGVPAVYCEKALACSLAEADALAEACRRSGAAFNIGTSRRYDPGYRTARERIAAGGIGQPRLVVAYAPGELLHTHSHTVDTILYLLGDPPVEEVQGEVGGADAGAPDRRLPADPPVRWAQIRCAGGARGVILPAPGRYEFEVVGTAGAILAYNNGRAATWALRLPAAEPPAGGRAVWEMVPFPQHDRSMSATLRAVTELAEAVRSGAPTSGGIEVALRQTEVCVAIAESHLQGGRPVRLPLAARDLYIPSR